MGYVEFYGINITCFSRPPPRIPCQKTKGGDSEVRRTLSWGSGLFHLLLPDAPVFHVQLSELITCRSCLSEKEGCCFNDCIFCIWQSLRNEALATFSLRVRGVSAGRCRYLA